jgi:hypothetical protein
VTTKRSDLNTTFDIYQNLVSLAFDISTGSITSSKCAATNLHAAVLEPDVELLVLGAHDVAFAVVAQLAQVPVGLLHPAPPGRAGRTGVQVADVRSVATGSSQ